MWSGPYCELYFYAICRFRGSCMREYDLILLTQGSKNNFHERGLHVKMLDSAPFK